MAEKKALYKGDDAVRIIEETYGVELTPIQERIVRLEGYATGIYEDDKGVKTTGVGQTGKFMSMTPLEAIDWHTEDTARLVKNFDLYPEELQAELVQLRYRGDMKASHNWLRLFNEGKYKDSAKELLNHQEYNERNKKFFKDGVVKRLEAAYEAIFNFAPSMTEEEKELTTGQLEDLFGETAEAPKSITIPGRERKFPVYEEETIDENAGRSTRLETFTKATQRYLDKAAGLLEEAEPVVRQALDTAQEKVLAGADKAVEGLDKAEAAMRTGIPKVLDATAGAIERAEPVVRSNLDRFKTAVLNRADRVVEGLDKAEDITRQAMDATLAKADTAVEGLDRAEAALRSRLGMEPTPESVPEEPVEEPPVPTSITIPGRERAFPQREQEAEAEVPTSITIPGRERDFPRTNQEVLAKAAANYQTEEQKKQTLAIREEVRKAQERAKPIEEKPSFTKDTTRVLRLEDIRNSKRLRQLHAMPGDLVKDNKLLRTTPYEGKILEDRDEQILGTLDLAANPALVEAGAEVGDKLINGQLVKTSFNDALTQLEYGFDSEGNDISEDSFFAYLGATVPSNQQFYNERYGPAFDRADFDNRVELIKSAKERDLIEEFGYDFMPNTESTAAVIGRIGKAVATPTSLLPLGKTVKTAAALGAFVGAEATVANQLAKQGDIRYSDVLINSILGAAVGAGTSKLFARYGNGQAIPDKMMLDRNGNTLMGGDARSRAAKLYKDGKITQTQLDNWIMRQARQVHEAVEAEVKTTSSAPRSQGGARDWYQILQTEVSRVYSAAGQGLKRFEVGSARQERLLLARVKPFFDEFRTLSDDVQRNITLALFKEDFETAFSFMSKSLRESFDEVIKVNKDVAETLKKLGHNFTERENYIHREVVDLAGLRVSLGASPNQGVFVRELKKYAGNKPVEDLPIDVQNKVHNKVAAGFTVARDKNGRVYWKRAPKGTGKLAIGKRTVDANDITAERLKYYAPLEEGFIRDLTRKIQDIEQRKFFGRFKDPKKLVDEADGSLNMDDSIGAMITRALDDGINPADQDRLRELIATRFQEGNQSIGSLQRAITTLGYVGTLANPGAAIIQLTDLATAGWLYGLRHTVAGMLKKEITLADAWHDDLVHDLAHSPSKASKATNFLFGLSGFRTIDRFGKEAVMNASLNKARVLAKTPKGVESLRKKYQYFFGDEFDSFVDDLRNGRVTDNVKDYTVSELLDIQPLVPSGMPVAWNKNPSMRWIYMLKSFTLKQYDLVRREIIAEARTNPANATKRAFLLGGYLSLAGMGASSLRDFMYGRNVKIEDLPDRALWSLAGVYGGNKYLVDRYLARGDVLGAIINLASPPSPILEGAGQAAADVSKVITGEEELEQLPEQLLKRTRGVPVIGPLVYYRLAGGAEAYNERNK